MRLICVLLLAAAFLTACGGGSKATPEPVFYLLRADARAPDGAMAASVTIGINRIVIADYLGQAGIVVATDDNQVRPARQHLWAEPLDSSIRLFLRDAISARLGYSLSADIGRRQDWDYRLDIRLDEWHGSLMGTARIDASWIVIDVDSDTEILRQRFRQDGVLKDDGYDALVSAQEQLLDALAVAVAASLASIDKPAS